jgi:hypothetical protein
MSDVPDIHDVLHWSNRTLVAEEITRRGFRVSKETLNRWVRQRKEVPAAVEHIVFELFGISGQQETPPPWAEAMQATIVSEVQANRAALYARLADEAAVKALQRAGLLPNEPTDETPDQPPGAVGPSQEPIT